MACRQRGKLHAPDDEERVRADEKRIWPLLCKRCKGRTANAMEGFHMSVNIIRLLPDQQQALLACYATGSKQPASFQELYDTMEVPTNAEPDRLPITKDGSL